jgi:hypothetical protein
MGGGTAEYQRLMSSLEHLRVQLHTDTQTPWASQIIGGHPSPTLIMRLQPGIAPGRPTQPGPIPIGITVRVPGHTGVEVVQLSLALLEQLPLLRPLLYLLKQLIRVGVQGGLHEAFRGGASSPPRGPGRVPRPGAPSARRFAVPLFRPAARPLTLPPLLSPLS